MGIDPVYFHYIGKWFKDFFDEKGKFRWSRFLKVYAIIGVMVGLISMPMSLHCNKIRWPNNRISVADAVAAGYFGGIAWPLSVPGRISVWMVSGNYCGETENKE